MLGSRAAELDDQGRRDGIPLGRECRVQVRTGVARRVGASHEARAAPRGPRLLQGRGRPRW
eukprot:15156971-Alexandrium_andersonii.AAC.1